MLDHIISVTGQEKIFYVGHSQGTMMGFSGFTYNKTLASYIDKFYALAPVATVQYIEGLFGFIARHYKTLAVNITTIDIIIIVYPIKVVHLCSYTGALFLYITSWTCFLYYGGTCYGSLVLVYY